MTVSDREQRAYTTFEAARICHVTHHSIKNWIKQGLIRASRTPGGHYRILEADLDSFREQYDIGGTVDQSTFIDQYRPAAERLATDVARTVVTAITEAF